MFNETVFNTGNLSILSKDETLALYLGERRKDIGSVFVLTIIYVCVFIFGIIGNASTCLVISRNPYMHTVTNYYLFSLAISDLLILLSGKFLLFTFATATLLFATIGHEVSVNVYPNR